MNERFGDKVKAIFDSITVLQAKDSDLKKTEKPIQQENKSKTQKNGLFTKATDTRNKSVVEELKKVKLPISKVTEKER